MFDLHLSAPADIAIRRALRGDLEGIARVSVDTWRHTYHGLLPDSVLERLRYGYQEDRHRRFLAEPDTAHRVAVEPVTQEVVGFANGGANRQASLGYEGEIYELYVQNGFQGRGVGKGLLDATRTALRSNGRRGLIVRVLSSNPNRGFYEHLGGKLVARQQIRVGGAPVEEVAYGWD